MSAFVMERKRSSAAQGCGRTHPLCRESAIELHDEEGGA